MSARRWRTTVEISDHRHRRLLRAPRERPRSRRAAECSQQFPPSDGDCHTPLPCEVRKRKDTTPRVRCPNCVATGAGGSARWLDVSSLPPFGWTYPLGGSGSFFFGRPLAGAVSAARRDRRLSPKG